MDRESVTVIPIPPMFCCPVCYSTPDDIDYECPACVESARVGPPPRIRYATPEEALA